MEQIAVAFLHVDQEGLNIIPLRDSFGQRSPAEQQAVLVALQASCAVARMEGVVVAAWLHASGVRYVVPEGFSSKLPKLSWRGLFGLINRQLSCGDPLVLAQFRDGRRTRRPNGFAAPAA